MAFAMTVSCSAFAGSTMAPLGEATTKGQAVESAAKIDAVKLPAVASIRRGSDIRPFLRPSVPAEVKTAALRRAWSTDPAIRDFVGMTEDLP